MANTQSTFYDWKKELILIRGLPGSGKSTKALEIIGETSSVQNRLPKVVEADDYFMIDGRYDWREDMRDLAHQWCLAEAFRRLRKSDRVIVANTFVKRWHIFNYVEQSRKFGVRVWVIESGDNHLPSSILADRNVHNVPVDSIERMKIGWEEITQKEVDIVLGLPVILRGEELSVLNEK